MPIPSEKHPPATATPAGFLHAVSRWVVEHTGLVTLFTVLPVTALCFGQWWLAYRQAQDWDAGHPDQPVPFRLFATTGWMLIIGAGIWVGLWQLSNREHQRPSTAGSADGWCFAMRKRQRVFEGRPLSRRLLWTHGLFGLLGLALGVALTLRLATAAGCRRLMATPRVRPAWPVSSGAWPHCIC